VSLQPAAFVAHGSPLAALACDAYADALARFGAGLERPKAIVIVSAHWQTPGVVTVGSAAKHQTIHDFGGFPDELFAIRYDAPGDPATATEIHAALGAAGIAARLDGRRGLDHGAWVPLRLMFPRIDVPVVPVSMAAPSDEAALIKLGATLAPLRERGVLVVGSGSITHNLREISMELADGRPEPWAAAFDDAVGAALERDPESLARWHSLPQARRAAPSDEHFDPLLVVAGARRPGDVLRPIHVGFHHRNLSMRSLAFATPTTAAA
jgi:4,5-DOPA dioxygenase extradiol